MAAMASSIRPYLVDGVDAAMHLELAAGARSPHRASSLSSPLVVVPSRGPPSPVAFAADQTPEALANWQCSIRACASAAGQSDERRRERVKLAAELVVPAHSSSICDSSSSSSFNLQPADQPPPLPTAYLQTSIELLVLPPSPRLLPPFRCTGSILQLQLLSWPLHDLLPYPLVHIVGTYRSTAAPHHSRSPSLID